MGQIAGAPKHNLPAVDTRVSAMLDALEAVAGRAVREWVRFVPYPAIAVIVDNWPRGSTAERAARLGLKPDPAFATIIGQYIDDCAASLARPKP